MAGQSKDDGSAEQSSSTTFNILLGAVFLDVFCACTTDPLRPSLLTDMGFSNTAISSVLARMTAAGATSEFILNPLCGRLSDKLGRKTFLVGGLLGTALANFATFLPFLLGRQPALPLLIFERCMRTACDTVIFTNVRASMSDFLAGAELTISASRVAMAAGVGVLLGPAFSTRVIVPMFGKPILMQGINVGILSLAGATSNAAFSPFWSSSSQSPYDTRPPSCQDRLGSTKKTHTRHETRRASMMMMTVSHLVFVFAALFLAAKLRETLPEEKRMPMDWSRANPLSFVKLLTASRTMFLWMTAVRLLLLLLLVILVRLLFVVLVLLFALRMQWLPSDTCLSAMS